MTYGIFAAAADETADQQENQNSTGSNALVQAQSNGRYGEREFNVSNHWLQGASAVSSCPFDLVCKILSGIASIKKRRQGRPRKDQVIANDGKAAKKKGGVAK